MQVVVLIANSPVIGAAVLNSLAINRITAWHIIDLDTAPGLRFSRLAKLLLATPNIAEHSDVIVEKINRLHREHRVDMVLGADVESLTILHKIRDRLLPTLFPMAPLAVLQTLNDKWQFYQQCCRLDVPVPRTLYFPASIDFAIVRRELGYPCIVKPLAASGSFGIVKLEREGEQERAAACSNVIVQRFIEGYDVGLSLFAVDGHIQASMTFRSGGKLETDFTEIAELTHFGNKMVADTNFTGVVNFDARIDADGRIFLLECNPRFTARLSAYRYCGLDLVRMGLLNEYALPNKTTGRVFSRRDLRWFLSVFQNAETRRIMLSSWLDYFRDPLPPMMVKVCKPRRPKA